MNKKERQHLDEVSQIGCIVCWNERIYGSPAEIHHIRAGMGMGMRNDNYHVIPLCAHHHRLGGHGVAIHAGKKTFEENFGTEQELLEQVERLIEDGRKNKSIFD